MGRFATTAALYEELRPPYPAEFFRTAAQRLSLGKQHSLIDLGTGPGLLALGFAPYVGRIVGVDPEPAMIAAARESGRGRVAGADPDRGAGRRPCGGYRQLRRRDHRQGPALDGSRRHAETVRAAGCPRRGHPGLLVPLRHGRAQPLARRIQRGAACMVGGRAGIRRRRTAPSRPWGVLSRHAVPPRLGDRGRDQPTRSACATWLAAC